MVFAFGAHEKQFSDPKAENLSLKALNQELVQNAWLFSHYNIGKKLYRLFATVLPGTLEIYLRVDESLSSQLARKVNELCYIRGTLTRTWHR